MSSTTIESKDNSDGRLSGLRSMFKRGMPEVDFGEAAPKGDVVREGTRVRLRRHVPGNRVAFQRWYADPEIAYLLRHDLKRLTERQSRGYFDTMILPLSLQGYCFAIHDIESDELIGSTALTDAGPDNPNAALFRIVIGEKWAWNRGFGTETTLLVLAEAFERLNLDEVQLEVFRHNPRAIAAYRKVGFVQSGSHTEYLPPDGSPLHVLEMTVRKRDLAPPNDEG
ncbi:MAG: GNAT family N-acetyltransferase [Thermomicrobiales bacterium]|nr:GNAT family N-acetyltransferase [Thermomicrobiales bacterium]